MLEIRERIFIILLLPALFFAYGEGYAQEGPKGVSSPKESVQAIDGGTASRKAETADKGKVQRTDTTPKIADKGTCGQGDAPRKLSWYGDKTGVEDRRSPARTPIVWYSQFLRL